MWLSSEEVLSMFVRSYTHLFEIYTFFFAALPFLRKIYYFFYFITLHHATIYYKWEMGDVKYMYICVCAVTQELLTSPPWPPHDWGAT